jgi:hypothetical protein
MIPELLLIYDADAVPVHKELLERTRWQKPALPAAGERGHRQEFVVNLGQPQRFTALR